MSNNPRADHQWKDKILRRERFADFAYTLARVNWDFFTTPYVQESITQAIRAGCNVLALVPGRERIQ